MEESAKKENGGLKIPPRGITILALVGPGLVWAGEYIGSGEVILCTRLGALLGTAILWAPMMAIFLKYVIGLSGARYTVVTGEGMMDMFGRVPGPGKWAVWLVLIGQFAAGAVSMSGLSVAAAAFIGALTPVNHTIVAWAVALFCVAVVWSGKFDPVKWVTSILVLVMVSGVLYVAWNVTTGLGEVLRGLFGFSLPSIPQWALESGALGSSNVWAEMLPVLGWAAGGFASQVWYSYWVLESGYGMAEHGGFGVPADEEKLASMDLETAKRVKGWCHVVYADATTALIVGSLVTSCFMLAGAGVLGKLHIAPNGAQVAIQLSELFGSFWGRTGAVLFLLAGVAAMVSTNVCQYAGWPRLMSDCLRIIFPPLLRKVPQKLIFRAFVTVFFFTNMVIINTFGVEPLLLVRLGAVLDGLLLCPVQALIVALALYWIAPRMLSAEARRVLRPGWFFLAGLLVSALVFGYFALVKIPTLL
ncbi:Nramp family divalent metal transporter [bacterium]|nr:Nramp family divalent metal transporter [bacterium]